MPEVGDTLIRDNVEYVWREIKDEVGDVLYLGWWDTRRKRIEGDNLEAFVVHHHRVRDAHVLVRAKSEKGYFSEELEEVLSQACNGLFPNDKKLLDQLFGYDDKDENMEDKEILPLNYGYGKAQKAGTRKLMMVDGLRDDLALYDALVEAEKRFINLQHKSKTDGQIQLFEQGMQQCKDVMLGRLGLKDG